MKLPWRWRRRDDDLDEEIRSHFALAEGDRINRGESPADARFSARREFGSVALTKEITREMWSWTWLEALTQDVRHGVRSLRRSPGLVIVSALSLGLGIGVNVLLYMGVSLVVGHRPTMTDPARMVGVEPGNANQFSYPDYLDLLRSGIFAGALGFRTAGVNLRSGDSVTPIGVLAVTANFFEVLGVQTRLGRTFSAVDAAAEQDPRVVVITQRFWQRRFGASSDVVGKSLILNGQSFAIVGVLPEGYRAVTGWMGPDLYVPIGRLILPTIDERGSPSLSVMARLAPNATTTQAQLAVTALGGSLERAYPERNQGMGRPASVFPAESLQFRGTPTQFFLVAGLLWASVGLVLVIACVNVTGLLMARAATRRSELAIRAALGAGRGRIVQAMLVESFLLVVGGAAVGLPLAFALGQVPWAGVMSPFQGAMTLDGRLLSYALAVVAVTTVFCGVLPALKATRSDLMTETRQGGGGVTARLWVRHALVVGQIAMSLMLIVFALLCVRSQISVGSMNLGFDIDHGVVARFSLDATQYPGQERVRFADRILAQVEQLSGVSSVSVANVVPLGGDALLQSFHPAGRSDIPGSRASTSSVGPRYFQSLAIPLLRGREFDVSHVAGAPRVAIVNETFAKTHFPGEDVVGKPIQVGGEPEAAVIGLVRDSRIDTIGEAPQSVVYYPFAQRPGRLILHVRTSVPPDGMVSAVGRAVERIDGTVPVTVQTLRGAASLELTMRRAGTVLMGSIGIVGLLLTLVGLYGVMAYVVASRTVEIAIRMALGASANRVRREILGQVLAIVAAGVAIGGAASMGLAPALRTFLVGVSPFDPVMTCGVAAILLVIVGLAAGLVPALRSSRVAPMQALRQQ